MSREALIIGNNYVGTSSELKGCFNDADEAASRLLTMGYVVTQMREATREQILDGLTRLVTRPGRKYFHYSGHGSRSFRKLLTGDPTIEADGADECLCGIDGDVLDDEIFQIIRKLSQNSQLVAVLDCCHSGTAFDLRYNYVGNSLVSTDAEELNARVIMFSGCADPQTSADVQTADKPYGAMTRAFFDSLGTGTIKKQISAMRKSLKAGGYSQVPQVSFGRFEPITKAVLDL
jgi:metacaspase-1